GWLINLRHLLLEDDITATHREGMTDMKCILTAIVLVGITTAALSSLGHTPTTKASANATVYLPLAMGGSGAQTSTPTPHPTPPHVDPAQLKADVIAAVNAERQQAGCALVTENVDLATARKHGRTIWLPTTRFVTASPSTPTGMSSIATRAPIG
nr:hypothetical protein [Chloroflexota bacterium]